MLDDGDLMPAQEDGAREKGALGNRAWQARELLRAARMASLATMDERQPHAALVTPACTIELSVLLLLSELSQHTRQLRVHPQCALLCIGAAPEAAGLVNPQTAPRLSLTCRARVDDDPALRARYLAVHPYATLYAGFGDFHLWTLEIVQAQFVGGFAQAWSLSRADMIPPAELAAALGADADRVIDHCNRDHADDMRLLGRAFGQLDAAWRLVGVDGDGCDLMSPAAAARASWPGPVASVRDLRAAMMSLVDNAREICAIRDGGAGATAGAPVS